MKSVTRASLHRAGADQLSFAGSVVAMRQRMGCVAIVSHSSASNQVDSDGGALGHLEPKKRSLRCESYRHNIEQRAPPTQRDRDSDTPHNEEVITPPRTAVGKIGFLDRILLKLGKLCYADWQIMKTHPLIGANILLGTNFTLVDVAAEIALSHHGQWDDSGFIVVHRNELRGSRIAVIGQRDIA